LRGRRTCAAAEGGSLSARRCPAYGFDNGPQNRFCGGCGAGLGAAGLDADRPPARAGGKSAAPPAPAEAERRRLTMMFVDIVGSTTLASRLDPEEMLDLVQRYQRGVAGVVAHAGGHVVKYLGDGVLACFGFPTAHEDAPSRAIRAALEVVARVPSQAHPVADTSGLGPLAIRVGVASGLAVVGRQTGDDAFETVTVVGEAVNVAARLQELAGPDQILAAAATRRLAAQPFRWRDLGERRLKGLSEPVAVHAVVAATSTARRRGLRPTTVPPTLVGRDHELDRLLGAWETARAGATRVVVVSGEPGIGKSALVRAFLRRTSHVPRRRLRFQCAPQERETALHPHRVQLEQGAGWRAHDPPDVKLDRLERLIALSGACDPQHAALLLIPTGTRYPPLTMGPQRQLQRTLEALYAQLLGLAARSPVVVV
jgi:class 3 adenylate cyclase